MDYLFFSALLAFAGYTLKTQAERKRIALLGQHLAEHDIEKLMQTLSEGYARALGERDVARRASIWQLLGVAESKLAAQVRQLAASFARVAPEQARVHRLPWPLGELAPWVKGSSFDLREALKVHADGLARALEPGESVRPQARAFTLSAEMLLMQHSCHWYCKSKAVASARMMVRHQTPYARLLESVSPETRHAYAALLGER